MNQKNRRLAGALCIAVAALSGANESRATPVAYNFSITGGAWDCGYLRPANQACPAALNGTLTVDSAQSDFTSQFVGFSLRTGDYLSFTRDELSSSGMATSFFNFDSSGAMTGFGFRNFFGPRGASGPLGESLNMYYMNLSAGAGGDEYRLGNRMDPIMQNECSGCVSFSRAVPEPGVPALLITALAGLWISLRRGHRPGLSRG